MIIRFSILRMRLFTCLLLLVLTSWTGRNTSRSKNSIAGKTDSSPLFRLLPSSQTGVDFTNTIYENDALNILNEAYIYNGGGVGIGDFNNDGLEDVYFSGNMVSSKLYLNKGALKFQDITDAAGVGSEGKWC